MILSNIKITPLPNGRTQLLFYCNRCGKEMEEPAAVRSFHPNTIPWRTQYYCEHCAKIAMEEDRQVREAKRQNRNWLSKLFG